MGSLDCMEHWAFRYVIRCQKRNDLDPSLGTLPGYSLYCGSSSQVHSRLIYHMHHGSQWTKTFRPLSDATIRLCTKKPRDTQHCLAMEDEIVLQLMYEAMQTWTHPEAWRMVGGGSWARPSNTKMPKPLQQRLQKKQMKQETKVHFNPTTTVRAS